MEVEQTPETSIRQAERLAFVRGCYYLSIRTPRQVLLGFRFGGKCQGSPGNLLTPEALAVPAHALGTPSPVRRDVVAELYCTGAGRIANIP